ncbi:MAG: hypothetical protein ACO3NW_11595, partial [Kiritimatiellia bacterium]
MKFPKSSKSGSTLLLTLLVVSLLLVIVTSFTVYVRLQLREVSNRIELIQARQNAKLGMFLALNKLQISAGPDQRVTARAEILGSSVSALSRFVTGVWDTENPNDDPDWLISMPQGQVFDPLTGPNPAASIPLLDAGVLGASLDNNDRILAGRINIPGSSNSGTYAWWVSDEGVKASLSLSDPFLNVTDIQTLDQTELKRLTYAVPKRNAQEYAFTGSSDFDSPALNEVTQRATDLSQY